MLKKTAFFLIIILTVQIISGIFAGAYEPFRNLIGQSAYLAESEDGTVLYEFNAHSRHPADSLAKVMTLLLAAYAVENDDISDNELITMTESAWDDLDENSNTLGIQPGEEMTFIDLMYSAYVGNSDEANNMIALRIAGSINSFISMMNNKANEIGALNTRFANPHGRYNELQYTTAYDQFLIFREAMKSALFSEVASTFRHITESTEEFDSRTVSSSNALINQGSRYYYRYCIAGRDSVSYEGGHSLVAMAEEDGLTLISVVLGSNDAIVEDGSAELRNFMETLRLFQWGYTNFAWRDILKTTELLERVPILHGSGADFVNARPESSLSLLLNNSVTTESFIKDTVIYTDEDNPLVAPVNSGDILGEVTVSRNGIIYAQMNLVANTDVNLNGIEYIRRHVIEMLSTPLARNIIIILILLLTLYVLLVIRYNIVRANRLRRIKNAKNDIIRDRHENFRD